MKEILFRGKCRDTGEWVYGSLILAGTYCCILELEENVHPMDYPFLDDDIGWIDGKATPVIPETVCRLIERPHYESYTDHIKIFEGDIVEVYYRHKDVMGDSRPKSIAIAVDEFTITENGKGRWFTQDIYEVKAIGNVYDNPELIGKKYADLYKYYHGFNTTITRDDLKRNSENDT